MALRLPKKWMKITAPVTGRPSGTAFCKIHRGFVPSSSLLRFEQLVLILEFEVKPLVLDFGCGPTSAAAAAKVQVVPWTLGRH